MALPTGTISMSQVNVELGLSATATISLNDAAVRGLAGVPSGAIGMNNLQGKSNVFTFTISSNQVNANLRTLALNAGWNGSSAVQATLASGVWVSGSEQANSTAALTIDGSWPGGITFINNGTIAGRGGNGGTGGQSTTAITDGAAGTTGGRALAVSVPVTIANNGTIAGGGGGGGGGGAGWQSYTYSCSMGEESCSPRSGGGGGGGGRSNISYNSSGAAGGQYSLGGWFSCYFVTNTGTYIGTSGTAPSGGTGTSGGPGGGGSGARAAGCNCGSCNFIGGGDGGAGGDWGAAGAAGTVYANSLNFAITTSAGGGGAAGQAVSGNGNITWTAFGTRLGPIV